MKKILALLFLVGCSSTGTKEETYFVSSYQSTNFLTRIDFFLSSEEIKEHPQVATAFQQAIRIWSNGLPIQALLYSGNTPPKKPGVIIIKLKENNRDTRLGLYHKEEKTLVLFYNKLIDYNLTLSVCLHELGHVFGIPHVINRIDENGVTGDLIIKDAEKYVMYPTINSDRPIIILSPFEIEYAKNRLIASDL